MHSECLQAGGAATTPTLPAVLGVCRHGLNGACLAFRAAPLHFLARTCPALGDGQTCCLVTRLTLRRHHTISTNCTTAHPMLYRLSTKTRCGAPPARAALPTRAVSLTAR